MLMHHTHEPLSWPIHVPIFLPSVKTFLPPDLTSFQGAAFGFHMIAAKAGEQLAPFLPQLIPRLYRYQFDPNLSIRQAMTSIWDALVTDKTLVGVHSQKDTICSSQLSLEVNVSMHVCSDVF